jgi:hypothetical protein
MFDNAKMPGRLQRHQIAQALFLLFSYFYAPCTRALEQLWMCRSIAVDPAGVYQVHVISDGPRKTLEVTRVPRRRSST